MTKRQTEKVRSQLHQKLSELMGKVDLRQGLITEWSSDPMDQIQSRQDLDMTVQAIDTTWRTRKAVETALKALDAGEYGICLDCGDNINPKRLQAIPWTSLCVHCQEEHDLAVVESGTDKKVRWAA